MKATETEFQVTKSPRVRSGLSPMQDDVPTEWKVERGFAFALLCLTVIGAVSYFSVVRLRADAAWVAHTREVISHLESLFSSVNGVQNSRRGYAITGDDFFLEPVAPGLQRMEEEIRKIQELTLDNFGQQRRVTAITTLIDAQLAFGQKVTETRRAQGFEAARDLTLTREGERRQIQIRNAVDEMKAVERALLVDRDLRSQQSVFVTKVIVIGGSVIAFVFVTFALLAIRRDFSGRRKAEAALRWSEENLAVTLQSIGDGVLATDTVGNITRMNRVAERLTGWTQSEAEGRPVAEVFRIINESTGAPAVIPVADVLASGEMRALANHTALIARDGTRRSIADSAAPIRDRSGGVIGVVLVFYDVSAERAAQIKLAAAQAELERFFTLSIDFLCISSADGFFKRVSPAVTDMLGWTVDEFLKQPFIDLVHPEDRAATLREVDRQVNAGEKVLQFENRYRHKDGSWRMLSWRSVPQPGGLMYATARDVTKSRLVEQEIRRLNSDLSERAAQVESANKELEAFSYSVSHDLRAPLRHVQGYVGMLTRDSDTPFSAKAKRFLSTISDSARQMGQLIDDLLSFSMMGRTELREAQFDLRALIDDVRREQELAVGDRKINWKIEVPPLAVGDAALLKQVFANLLGNAVKYSRSRNPTEIEIGWAGEEAGRMILFVRDNGAGFDMKYANKLFGVFQRLHRAEEFEGTGIGLANVQRIVLRHGGRVWAEGKIDRGATFYFTLRISPASLSSPESQV